MNIKQIDAILDNTLDRTAPAIRAEISIGGELVYSACKGWLDPETKMKPLHENTYFDLASVSKLFTAVSFMHLVEEGLIGLDQKVSSILPAFSGMRQIRAYENPLNWGTWIEPKAYKIREVDAGLVTFRHLLTHTSGLPAWRPFKDQPDTASARKMLLGTTFFYPTGEDTVYSDLGLILTGMAMEEVCGRGLDEIVREKICEPLGLTRTGYLPLSKAPFQSENFAPTEFCVMRQRRVLGEVHDENAWRLGGVAGHAGVFSTATDLRRFGEALLQDELLKPQTLAEMTKQQFRKDDTRRGIGFQLRSSDPEASSYALSDEAYGHTGFTGTSIWIDPQRELVCVLLTNRVYYGRDASAILKLRRGFYNAVAG